MGGILNIWILFLICFHFESFSDTANNIYIELYGKCLNVYDPHTEPNVLINISKCECQYFDPTFIPAKIWTKNGPIKLSVKQRTSLKAFIAEDKIDYVHDMFCSNLFRYKYRTNRIDNAYLLPTLQTDDDTKIVDTSFTPFFDDNGNTYVSLVNPVTVIWLKINDPHSEQYMVIENENGETEQQMFELGFEEYGYELLKVTQMSQDTIKIEFKPGYCNKYKNGFRRFVIFINETDTLKATFFDKISNENLKIYYLAEEKSGIPSLAFDESKLHKMILPFIKVSLSSDGFLNKQNIEATTLPHSEESSSYTFTEVLNFIDLVSTPLGSLNILYRIFKLILFLIRYWRARARRNAAIPAAQPVANPLAAANPSQPANNPSPVNPSDPVNATAARN